MNQVSLLYSKKETEKEKKFILLMERKLSCFPQYKYSNTFKEISSVAK